MPNRASSESLGVAGLLANATGDANEKPNKNDIPFYNNHRNEFETNNTGVIMDSDGNELDEEGNKRDPGLKGLPLDIKKIGYMKKLKVKRKDCYDSIY